MDITTLPEAVQRYLEARDCGTLPAYYLAELRKRRTEYSDELPIEDARLDVPLTDTGHYVEPKLKCRGNYITGLGHLLQLGIEDGTFTDELTQTVIDTFRQYDFNFHHGRRTTPTEIELINATLDFIIKSLE